MQVVKLKVESKRRAGWNAIGRNAGYGQKMLLAATAVFATTSSTRSVVAAEPAADKNYMGLGIANPNNSTNAPIFADLMKATGAPSQANSDSAAAVDANGWPTTDAKWFLIDGAFTKNITGTYKLRFNGQATISLQFGGMTVSGQTYDAASNTTNATLNCTQTTTIILKFTNTKRTNSSATNTGITNVQLMRPIAVGSTTSYAFTDVFTNQIKTMGGKFHLLRFMDFHGTNSNGDVAWANRLRPISAPRNSPSGYGWQGEGAAWEYAVRLANDTNSDMWINVPVKANDDYITKLAQLVRFGSDGTNPYTSTQTNPVFAPLNSGLKVYVEYSNELWNFAGGFRQNADNQELATAKVNAGGSPLNYDGSTDAYTWARRHTALQIVKISNAFRAVWGDSNMMTRVRPLLEWQYNDGSGTASFALSFIENWYNNADGNHVATPRPVNYFLWGGGSAAYYNPIDNNSDTLTVNQILDESDPTKRTSQWDYMLTDIVWTTMYGLKRVAYEGGLGLGDDFSHSLAAKKSALADARLQDVVKNAQNRWSNFGGDLLVYFESSDSPGYGHTDEDFSTSTQKLQAIDSLRASTKASPTIGTPIPATIDGNNWQTNSRGYGSNGTGSVSPFGTVGDAYGTPAISFTSYLIRVPSTGTYSIKVNYSSNVSTSLQIMASGNVLGNATIGNNGGSAADTATYSATLNAGLQNIRLKAVAGSPNYTINSVVVSGGGSSTPTPTPAPGGSKYEAESASLSGGASIATNHSGYSGSGFVDGYWNLGAATTFNINASSAGTSNVILRYANATGNNSSVSIYVNGSKIRQTSLPSLASWDTWGDKVEALSLNSGNNTVAYKYDSGDNGNVNLDYVYFNGGGGTGGSGTAVALINPGFESGMTGWLGGGAVFGVNSAAPRSGSNNSYNNGAYNSIYQNVTGLQTNTSYTLKAWARLGSAVSGNNQSIFVNNNGTSINTWISGTTYTQYTVNFTTGSNTSVQIGNADSNGSSAVAYTDDYTLTKN